MKMPGRRARWMIAVVAAALIAAVVVSASLLVARMAVAGRINRLVKGLSSKDRTVSNDSLARLSHLTDRYEIACLVDHLGEADEKTRKDVADILVSIGAPAAKPLVRLTAGAHEISWWDEINITYKTDLYLPWRKGTVFRDGPFAGLISDTRERRIWSSLIFLLPRMSPSIVNGLLEVADSGDRDGRLLALGALSTICDPRAIDAFIKAARDKDQQVATTAVGGIDALKEKSISVLADPTISMQAKAHWKDYQAKEGRTVDALLGAARAGGQAGWGAVHALRRYHGRKGMSETLANMLASPQTDDTVRGAIAINTTGDDSPVLLGALREPGVLTFFLAKLKDANRGWHNMAIWALIHIPDDVKLGKLISMLRSNDTADRAAAALFFDTTREARYVDALAAAYGSADAAGRAAIVGMLDRLKQFPPDQTEMAIPADDEAAKAADAARQALEKLSHPAPLMGGSPKEPR